MAFCPNNSVLNEAQPVFIAMIDTRDARVQVGWTEGHCFAQVRVRT